MGVKHRLSIYFLLPVRPTPSVLSHQIHSFCPLTSVCLTWLCPLRPLRSDCFFLPDLSAHFVLSDPVVLSATFYMSDLFIRIVLSDPFVLFTTFLLVDAWPLPELSLQTPMFCPLHSSHWTCATVPPNPFVQSNPFCLSGRTPFALCHQTPDSREFVVEWLLCRSRDRLKFIFSPDITLCGWLGSKYQLVN